MNKSNLVIPLFKYEIVITDAASMISKSNFAILNMPNMTKSPLIASNKK